MPQKKTTTKKILNTCEVKFCYEYISNGFNGSKAYVASHRSNNLRAASVMANRLLAKPNIKRLIKTLTEKHLTKLSYTATDILKELSKNAFSDIKDFVSWSTENGVIIKDSEELGEFSSCIKEIEIDARETIVDGNPTGLKDYKIKCKLHSKTKALELLGKNLLLFADKLKIETDDTTGKFKRIAEIMDAECRSDGDRSDHPDTT